MKLQRFMSWLVEIRDDGLEVLVFRIQEQTMEGAVEIPTVREHFMVEVMERGQEGCLDVPISQIQERIAERDTEILTFQEQGIVQYVSEAEVVKRT